MTVAACEIIQVLDDGTVAGSPVGAVRYVSPVGEPLQPGFYVALWLLPRGRAALVTPPRVFGPVPTQAIAAQLKVSAEYLQIAAASGRERTAAEQGDGEGRVPGLPAQPCESKIRRSLTGEVVRYIH